MRFSHWSVFVLVLFLPIACFGWGWYAHTVHSQDSNDLLDAGFVILDPEGYEIERFDSGWDINYWTKEPK